MNVGDIVWQKQCLRLADHGELRHESPSALDPLAPMILEFSIEWMDCDRQRNALGNRGTDGWVYVTLEGVRYRHRVCDVEYFMACMAEGNVQ